MKVVTVNVKVLKKIALNYVPPKNFITRLKIKSKLTHN